MIYCLEAYNTSKYEDVRYREYTRSAKKAEKFGNIPKIQFYDNGHGIVFCSIAHGGRRKPEIRILHDYVRKHLK